MVAVAGGWHVIFLIYQKDIFAVAEYLCATKIKVSFTFTHVSKRETQLV